MPRYGLRMQILDIANMPLTLLLGILVGLLPLLLIISKGVTGPLRELNEALRKFSAGDFSQKLRVETEDEIGEVAKCFNDMVEDIRTLIDENYVITLREKKANWQLFRHRLIHIFI